MTASGQQAQNTTADGPVYVFIGGAVGGAGFPGAFDPQCSSGTDGTTAAAVADLRAGITTGPWRVDVRRSKLVEAVMEDCAVVFVGFREGTHTYRMTPIEPGGVTTTDIRVAFSPAEYIPHWKAFAGVGWVWGANVPVLTIGAGVGLGRRFRVGLDGELSYYRMPWHIITAEWRDGQLVEELARDIEHDWQHGFTVRLHIELAPVRLR